MTSTLGFLLVVFVFGVWVVAKKLEEIVDVLKQLKDLSDVIVDVIERIERDLQGHE